MAHPGREKPCVDERFSSKLRQGFDVSVEAMKALRLTPSECGDAGYDIKAGEQSF
jgi:hypothetical protein